ncbi:MAG: hypothetical protein U9R00_00605 [Patescibacteria group bacterium]|nr:hypothetical protein [Patescibacteria group bacterium]
MKKYNILLDFLFKYDMIKTSKNLFNKNRKIMKKDFKFGIGGFILIALVFLMLFQKILPTKPDIHYGDYNEYMEFTITEKFTKKIHMPADKEFTFYCPQPYIIKDRKGNVYEGKANKDVPIGWGKKNKELKFKTENGTTRMRIYFTSTN